MNVVGYIRELSTAESGEMFAQSERVRRWVARNGYHLVALCQDASGTSRDRVGFKALLGLAGRGQADLVVIPGLETLSSDKVVQEIMLDRLRSHRLAVVSTEESEHELIATPSTDPARMLIRDVLFRVDQYSDLLEPTEAPPALRIAPRVEEPDTSPIDTDVLIEFVEEAPTASAS